MFILKNIEDVNSVPSNKNLLYFKDIDDVSSIPSNKSWLYFYPTVKPKFHLDARFQRTMTIRAGTTFHIDIPFKATPTPTVTWTCNNKTVTRSYRTSIDTNDYGTNLTVRTAERSDSGDYVIKASNKAGQDTVTVTVNVVDCPSPPQGPLAVVKLGSSEVTLTWNQPHDDGGSPVTGFILEKREGGYGTWTKVASGVPDTTFR